MRPIQTNITLSNEAIEAIKYNASLPENERKKWLVLANELGVGLGKVKNHLQLLGLVKKRAGSQDYSVSQDNIIPKPKRERPKSKDQFWCVLQDADPLFFNHC